VISWASAGKAGFRGSKKNTPYAAQIAAADAAKRLMRLVRNAAEVYVKGPGSGREAAIRAIDSSGIKVTKSRT
jgi:small subunit ribosomal protein S11